MSSPSSSSLAASASSPPAASADPFAARGHASSENLGAFRADTALDRRMERRRSTLSSGSDRKRRLVSFEGDGWSHHARSAAVMEAGSSSRAVAVDSRAIPEAASAGAGGDAGNDIDVDAGAGAGTVIPGSSFAAPIDLSSSPPQPQAQAQAQVHQPQQNYQYQQLRPQQQQQQQQQPPRQQQQQQQQASARPHNTHRSSWSQNAIGYMEYTRPRWQPDSEVTNCPICGAAFSFWFRKHHCRKCGRVVCASCSPHRITIPRQFIVRPPDANQIPAAALVPTRVAQVIDSDENGTAQSLAAFNPALGGGEEVRLCNPCVPDPNPEPPRPYPAVRGIGDPGASWGMASPSQPRHRSYHSVSTPLRQFPYDAFTGPPSSRFNRRSTSSNEYQSFGGGFGGVLPSSLQERSMRHGSFSSSYNPTPQISSSARPYLGYFPAHRHLPSLAAEGITGRSISTSGIDQVPYRRGARGFRRHIDERDACPICNAELPPLGENGNQDAREAHIRDCIESHGHGRRSSSRGSSPVSAPAAPVRMLAFTATEKDCLGHDGAVQECTICMEDYEVGQALVRLECLCRFHKRCIVEWFERKKECPVHKVS